MNFRVISPFEGNQVSGYFERLLRNWRIHALRLAERYQEGRLNAEDTQKLVDLIVKVQVNMRRGVPVPETTILDIMEDIFRDWPDDDPKPYWW